MVQLLTSRAPSLLYSCSSADTSTIPSLLDSAIRNDRGSEAADITELLLDEYQAKGANLACLLHSACEYSPSEEVVELLLEYFPESLESKDSNSKLPLQRSAQNPCHSGTSIFRLVLEAAPQVLDQICPAQGHPTQQLSDELVARLRLAVLSSFQSQFALHAVCERRYINEDSLEMIRAITASDAQAVQRKDASGNLPLHLVAEHSLSAAAAEVLIAADPQAVLYTDAYGDLPIHLMLSELQGRRMDGPEQEQYAAPGFASVLCQNSKGLQTKGSEG